jgi:hypothetical protein
MARHEQFNVNQLQVNTINGRQPNIGLDVGNVYRVLLKSKVFYSQFMALQFQYSDGSLALYGDDGDGLGIAAAITACKGGRNDYVIVGTGAYTLTVPLTCAGKSSVHLIAQNGLGRDIGCVGATVLTQSGAYQAVIMEAYGELAGFSIINKTTYSAVTAAIGVVATNIHHNTFKIVGGGATTDNVSLLLNSYGSVTRNRWFTYSGGVLNSVLYNGEGTGVDVSNNVITASAGAVYTYGIYCDAISGMVSDNYISESGGDGATTYGGTITNAIKIPAHACAINNRCAVGTGQGLNGGTDEHSFVQNFDAASGGSTALET